MEEFKIEIGLEILSTRIECDLTQAQLAKRVGTKQPAIARAERGRLLASLGLLSKIACATKRKLLVRILPNDERITSHGTHTIYQTI